MNNLNNISGSYPDYYLKSSKTAAAESISDSLKKCCVPHTQKVSYTVINNNTFDYDTPQDAMCAEDYDLLLLNGNFDEALDVALLERWSVKRTKYLKKLSDKLFENGYVDKSLEIAKLIPNDHILSNHSVKLIDEGHVNRGVDILNLINIKSYVLHIGSSIFLKINDFKHFLVENLPENRGKKEIIDKIFAFFDERKLCDLNNPIEIKLKIGFLKGNIANLLKEFSQDDLLRLEKLFKIAEKPSFLENIFYLAGIYKKLEISKRTLNVNIIQKIYHDLNNSEVVQSTITCNVSKHRIFSRRSFEPIVDTVVKQMKIAQMNDYISACLNSYDELINTQDSINSLVEQMASNDFFMIPNYGKSSSFQVISNILMQNGKTNAALDVAYMIPCDTQKSYALQYISSVLVENGRIDLALNVAHSIPDETTKFFVFRNIFYGTNIDFFKTKYLVNYSRRKKIKSIEVQRELFIGFNSNVASRELQNKNLKKLEVSTQLKNIKKSYVLRDLSSTLLGSNNVVEAVVFANLIPEEQVKCYALQEISCAMANKGNIYRATSITNSITDESIKTAALHYLSIKLTAEYSKAIIFENFLCFNWDVIDIFYQSKIPPIYCNNIPRLHIDLPLAVNVPSVIYVIKNYFAEIFKNFNKENLNKIENLSKNIEMPNFFKNIFNLAKIYRKIETIQKEEIKEDLKKRIILERIFTNLIKRGNLDEVMEIVCLLSQDDNKTLILEYAAYTLVNNDYIDEALYTNNLLIEYIKTSNHPFPPRNYNRNDSILLYIVIALIKKDDMNKAKKIAYSITSNDLRFIALKKICKALARKNTISESRFDEARDVANSIFDEKQKSLTLKKMCIIIANIKNIDQVMGIVHSIPDETQKSSALKYFSGIFMMLKNRVDTAISTALLIPNEDKKISALKNIAKILIRDKKIAKAQEVICLIPSHTKQFRALNEKINVLNHSN